MFDGHYLGFTDQLAKNATVSVGGNHRLGASETLEGCDATINRINPRNTHQIDMYPRMPKMNRPVCKIQCDVSVVDRFGDVFELCVIWFTTPR